MHLGRTATPTAEPAPEELNLDHGQATASEQAEPPESFETRDAPDESTQTPWGELGFSSAEALAEAYRNLNSFRGKQANEIGELRRRLEYGDLPGDGDRPAPAGLGQEEILAAVDEVLQARMGLILDAVAETVRQQIAQLAGAGAGRRA